MSYFVKHKFLIYSRLIATTLTLFFALFFVASTVWATAYNSSDVLGQLDDDGVTPVFTSNSSVNNMGFYGPQGFVLDSVNHRLFVSDISTNRVLVFNLDVSNNLVDRIADYVLGQPNLHSNIAVVTQSSLVSPRGLAYDSTNQRLFVADRDNNRVMVFDVASITSGENAVNVLGQTDFVSSLVATTQNGLYSPYDVVYDGTNQRLFVADATNNRVMVFDVASISDGENAVNVLGQSIFTLRAAGTSSAIMSFPIGLTYDSTNQRLFLADKNNNRVMVFDVASISDGENAVNVLGQLDFVSSGSGLAQNRFNHPYGLTYDSTNQRLFVADATNNRVMVFDVASISDGENAVNVLGQLDFVSNNGSITQNGLTSPADVLYDLLTHTLYVADSFVNRVMVFDVASISDGENAVNVLGQLDEANLPVYTRYLIYNTPNKNNLNSPNGIAIDRQGQHLFVSEYTYRVLVYDLDANGQLIDRLPDYVLGRPDFINYDTQQTTQSSLWHQNDLAYDSTNQRLFVADRGNNRVMVFDVASITNGENAVNVLGQSDFVSSGSGLAQNRFNYPYGLVYDSSSQRLFVSDLLNNRVMVFDVASITNGENAVNVLGQSDFVSNSANTTQNTMYSPSYMTMDENGQRLFVGDLNNSRLLVFDVSSIINGENAVNVLGQPDFTSSTPGLSQNFIEANISGLSYDSIYEQLFVSDTDNNRVLVFDVSSIINGENAVNVLGQPDFTSSTLATTQTGMYSPRGLAYDNNTSRLYVADYYNNRILIYDFVRITTTSLANGTVGVVYNQTISTTNNQGSISFSLQSGTLPPGLSVGSLSGTPTSAGIYTFTIRSADTFDGRPFIDDQQYTLTIAAAAAGGSGVFIPLGEKPIINNGDSCVGDRNVILTLTASFADKVRISNYPDMSDAEWLPFPSDSDFTSQDFPWTLPEEDGEHVVYVQFRSIHKINSSLLFSSVQLDQAGQCGKENDKDENENKKAGAATEENDTSAGWDENARASDVIYPPVTLDIVGAKRVVTVHRGNLIFPACIYDLYMVNPDKSVRYTQTDAVQEKNEGQTTIYFFEDKNDNDFNDVVVSVKKDTQDDKCIFDIEILSVEALWHHRFGIEFLANGQVADKLLLWPDTHKPEIAPEVLGVADNIGEKSAVKKQVETSAQSLFSLINLSALALAFLIFAGLLYLFFKFKKS